MLVLFIRYACIAMHMNCMWPLDDHIQPEQSDFLLPANLPATAEGFLLMQGWTLHPCNIKYSMFYVAMLCDVSPKFC